MTIKVNAGKEGYTFIKPGGILEGETESGKRVQLLSTNSGFNANFLNEEGKTASKEVFGDGDFFLLAGGILAEALDLS